MSITLKNVSYSYNLDEKELRYAVKDVSFSIEKGEFVGLIGHTGSGKSTLAQMLNGLEKPTSGQVLYDGKDVHEKGYSLKELRQKVGLVFQYPEYQLFEETVLKDVCFGPKNLKFSKEEQIKAAKNALRLVGLSEEYEELSPFDLSGGEKRRVAIAGVLAMKPDFLILDEPTAGLDPAGRTEILNQVKKLNEEENIGVLLISHSMDDVAAYASRILVMNNGLLRFDDSPKEVFKHADELEEMGLAAPEVTYILQTLKEAGLPVSTDAITIEEAKESILKALKK